MALSANDLEVLLAYFELLQEIANEVGLYDEE
jgi:hypothetical protein